MAKVTTLKYHMKIEQADAVRMGYGWWLRPCDSNHFIEYLWTTVDLISRAHTHSRWTRTPNMITNSIAVTHACTDHNSITSADSQTDRHRFDTHSTAQTPASIVIDQAIPFRRWQSTNGETETIASVSYASSIVYCKLLRDVGDELVGEIRIVDGAVVQIKQTAQPLTHNGDAQMDTIHNLPNPLFAKLRSKTNGRAERRTHIRIVRRYAT